MILSVDNVQCGGNEMCSSDVRLLVVCSSLQIVRFKDMMIMAGSLMVAGQTAL